MNSYEDDIISFQKGGVSTKDKDLLPSTGPQDRPIMERAIEKQKADLIQMNKCPECWKDFDTYGEMIDHYWNVHDENNPALENVR